MLVTAGMRNDAIDLDATRRRGITVCGTRLPGHATAEVAMALARGHAVKAASMRAGGWQVGLGRDLRGGTLGILGLGRIGRQVAGLGRAFGMEVIGWSENLTEAHATAVGARRVAKDELFPRADFITIHLRFSGRTVGLVDAHEIALMRPDAYLVNTSRGPIVDETALTDAVEHGRIGGAALDVYEVEPLPANHRLRRVSNLLLTPHIGYVTRETYQVFYRETVERVRTFLDGQPRNALPADAA
jgi:phosphoglycerate dehydrogenase-like enzyme